MSFVGAILFLGLAVSTPAIAGDEGGIRSAARSILPPAEVAPWDEGRPLHARGPGTLFTSVDAAAVDALSYAYLQARESRDTARIRGGTIYPIGDHYSYAEIRAADPLSPHRISYRFGPQEVARFHVYPVYRNALVNRANERLSPVDRRSVKFVDPLHRTLYVLHPSLSIRAYSGEDSRRIEVADLRHRERTPLFADN